MSHFICATRDESLRAIINVLQSYFGFTVHFVLSIDSLSSLMSQFKPEIGLCDFDISPADVLELPNRYRETAWILRMPSEMGWAAVAEIGYSSSFVEVIPSQVSVGNIFEALSCCAEREDSSIVGSTIRHAMAAWQDLVFGKSPACALSSLALPEGKDRLCGSLVRTPWLSILYRIYKDKASGVVHLRRKYTHLAITFNAGYPVSADTRALGAVVGFDAWYSRHGNDAHIDERLPSMRYRRQKEESEVDPKLFERRRAYVTAVVEDVFAWPTARFEFIPMPERAVQPEDPVFSPHDIEEIMQDAALVRIPSAMIHEVTHSALSYFLKLNDNASGFCRGVLPAKANVVVERLQSGSRLNEMLAMLPSHYPVQRIVYLVAMMDELNWLS